MYKRRIKVFLALIAFVVVVLLVRLWTIQSIRADEYLDWAETYLRRGERLPAMRGQILDRNGRILAIDEACFDLCLDYPMLIADEKWFSVDARRSAQDSGEPIDDPGAAWARNHQQEIARTLDLSPERAEHVFRRRWNAAWQLVDEVAAARGIDPGERVASVVERVQRLREAVGQPVREQFVPHAIVRGLSEAAAASLRARVGETVGVTIRPSRQRVYPRGETACHIIGLTGAIDPDELTRYNTPERRPDPLRRYALDDTIGKSGIEKLCEPMLQGRKGRRVRRGGKLVQDVPPRPGRDVHLTLDAELQEAIASAFEAKHPGGTGSVVVLDVSTGDVLAMVSLPGYDLNRYRETAYFRGLLDATTRLPLRHRAVAQAYAPGSTAKPVAGLSALGAGKVGVHMKFVCQGGYMFPNVRTAWRCWSASKGFGHGEEDLVEGLRHSCNVYFYHVGQAMGPQLLCEWYRLFGYGELPGTGLPEERPGLVPTQNYIRRTQGRNMSVGDARLMAIGQGTFAATPLQVANAMCTIARGGHYMSPLLTLEGGPKRIRRYLPMSAAAANAVRQGMHDVVHHPRGTAYRRLRPLIGGLDFEFCGKTGTADVPPQRVDSNDDGRITADDAIVRSGNMAWFAGFAPYRNPKIAFAVVVEYVEGGGGENAAPVAVEVLKRCRDFGYVN